LGREFVTVGDRENLLFLFFAVAVGSGIVVVVVFLAGLFGDAATVAMVFAAVGGDAEGPGARFTNC
jgi:hypothetical protein